MMKNAVKILLSFLTLSLLLQLLTGCKDGPGTGSETETDPAARVLLTENGQALYTIVRPDVTDQAIVKAGSRLKAAIDYLSGGEIRLTTDFEAETENEILIGNTARKESAEAAARLGDSDFLVTRIGTKIVVVGKDAASVSAGVRCLIRTELGFASEADGTGGTKATLSLAEDLYYSEVISMKAPDPSNPNDFLICTASVLDYGAAGDGKTDDTKAFQAALDAVRDLGGGTVFAPAGWYVIKGSLTVGTSVYLAGEWTDPEKDPDAMKHGTVLCVEGSPKDALITIGASAGVNGLTVWYPNQSVDKPKEYPAAIRIRDGISGDGTQHASSIQNLTVVNAWKAIDATSGLQLPTLKTIRVSALSSGFAINGCYDCARIIDLRVSPEYWAAFAGIDVGTVAEAMKKEAVGFTLMRTDAQMMFDLVAASCHTGVALLRDTTNGGETAGSSAIHKMTVRDCTVGIRAEYNAASFSDTVIETAGSRASIEVTASTSSTSSLRLCGCTVKNASGPVLSVEEGTRCLVSLQNCTLENGGDTAVAAEGGVLSLTSNRFTGKGTAMVLGDGVKAAALSDNWFGKSIENAVVSSLPDSRLSAEHSIKEPTYVTSDPVLPTPPIVHGTDLIFDVTEYGAARDGKTDDTAAFEKAIRAAQSAGGGTVYVPAGYYKLEGSLSLPTGVELRGVSECIHVSSGAGSVLYITDGQGDGDGTAFLTLAKGSGVRGLTFWYPEQAWNAVKAYPYAIRVLGQDCAIRNICLGNCFRGIDMASADCGGHYVENVTGSVLDRGIILDGSTKAGALIGTHFNLTFYFNIGSAKLSDASGSFGYDMAVPLMGYLNQNMTAYEFGTAKDELLLFVFNYRARYGMVFTGGFEGTVVGCGVDGSLCGVKITGSYDRELTLLSFSDDIVPGSTPEGNVGIFVDAEDGSVIRFVSSGASSYNYVPSDLVKMKNGELILEGFTANVTPANRNGALRVEGGHVRAGGMVFRHVGPLDGSGAFTEQPDTSAVVDVVVTKDGSLELLSAIGERFFRTDYKGDAEAYCTVTTD